MAKKNNKRESKTFIFLKFLIIAIFLTSLTWLFYQRISHYLRQSSLFEVKKIEMSSSLKSVQSHHLTRLIGKNIFSINLRDVQKKIQTQYPEVDQLKILKKYPDTILVTARKREPFAMLSNPSHDILVDNEGVVLSFGELSDVKLPSISGIPLRSKIALGQSLKSKELNVALYILRSFQGNGDLSHFEIATVNVHNLSKIDFYLSNNLKIIYDQDKILQKTKNLGILLSQGNLDFSKIQYIDLRFKEPILGKKETKN